MIRNSKLNVQKYLRRIFWKMKQHPVQCCSRWGPARKKLNVQKLNTNNPFDTYLVTCIHYQGLLIFLKLCWFLKLQSVMYYQVPSYVLLGIPHGTASPSQPLLLTPMGEACLRVDLTAFHEILDKTGYKDDEGIANEVCFYARKTSRSFSFCTPYFCEILKW